MHFDHIAQFELLERCPGKLIKILDLSTNTTFYTTKKKIPCSKGNYYKILIFLIVLDVLDVFKTLKLDILKLGSVNWQ